MFLKFCTVNILVNNLRYKFYTKYRHVFSGNTFYYIIEFIERLQKPMNWST